MESMLFEEVNQQISCYQCLPTTDTMIMETHDLQSIQPTEMPHMVQSVNMVTGKPKSLIYLSHKNCLLMNHQWRWKHSACSSQSHIPKHSKRVGLPITWMLSSIKVCSFKMSVRTLPATICTSHRHHGHVSIRTTEIAHMLRPDRFLSYDGIKQTLGTFEDLDPKTSGFQHKHCSFIRKLKPFRTHLCEQSIPFSYAFPQVKLITILWHSVLTIVGSPNKLLSFSIHLS